MMRSKTSQIRSSFVFVKHCVCVTFLSKKAAVIAFVELLVLWDVLSPVADFSFDIGYRVNPGLFVFVVGDPLCQLFFMVGIVFLVSNVPFLTTGDLFVLLRLDRATWAAGQIVSLFAISILYSLGLFALFVIVLLPCLTFSTFGWGTVVNTLAQTNAAHELGLSFEVAEMVMSQLDPVQALFCCVFFQAISGMILGCTVLVANELTHSHGGAAAAAFIVLLDLLTTNLLPARFFLFSPVSHSRLQILDFLGTSFFYPTPYMAVAYDIVLLIVLSGLSAILLINLDIEQNVR